MRNHMAREMHIPRGVCARSGDEMTGAGAVHVNRSTTGEEERLSEAGGIPPEWKSVFDVHSLLSG